MKKTYTFQPILNIGDTVYIIKYNIDGWKVIKSKIDDIRYSCAEGIVEYSTEDSDHFEGQGWYRSICFNGDEIYGTGVIIRSDTIYIKKEDAEKAYMELVED